MLAAEQGLTMRVFRGEVYMIDFGAIRGNEQALDRPAVILSINELNRLAFVINVVPGTDAKNISRDYPSNVRVVTSDSGLWMDTVFKCDQITAVDPKRIRRKAGKLSASAMQRVEDSVRYVLGLGI